MRIRVSKTLLEDVDIDSSNMKEIAIKVVCDVFKFNYGWYINNNGDLCEDEEVHTSHSWTTTEIVRKATSEDINILEVLRKIRTYK